MSEDTIFVSQENKSLIKAKEEIHSDTKDQFHEMPKFEHKGIIPKIYREKTFIKT